MPAVSCPRPWPCRVRPSSFGGPSRSARARCRGHRDLPAAGRPRRPFPEVSCGSPPSVSAAEGSQGSGNAPRAYAGRSSPRSRPGSASHPRSEARAAACDPRFRSRRRSIPVRSPTPVPGCVRPAARRARCRASSRAPRAPGRHRPARAGARSTVPPSTRGSRSGSESPLPAMPPPAGWPGRPRRTCAAPDRPRSAWPRCAWRAAHRPRRTPHRPAPGPPGQGRCSCGSTRRSRSGIFRRRRDRRAWSGRSSVRSAPALRCRRRRSAPVGCDAGERGCIASPCASRSGRRSPAIAIAPPPRGKSAVERSNPIGARGRWQEGGGVACHDASIAKILVPIDEAHLRLVPLPWASGMQTCQSSIGTTRHRALPSARRSTRFRP